MFVYECVPLTLAEHVHIIDLSEKNAGALRAALDPYLSVAARLGRCGIERRSAITTRRPAQGINGRELNQRIREWAPRNGHTVSERGRIPQTIVDAYNA